MPLPFTARRTDPDAAAYCARSGASDRAALSAFVRGVKDLGLWESMVCWPLRSTQNAGTGTTAYSLGGLGTYNGTLVDGPVWGVDGVTIDGSKEITTTGLTHNASITDSTILASVKPSTTSAGAYIIAQAYGAEGGVRLRQDGAAYGVSVLLANGAQSVVTSISSSASAGSFAFTVGSFSAAGSHFAVANSSVSGTATTTRFNGTSDSFKIGLSAANFSGDISFAAHLLNKAMSSSEIAALFSLYKSTLGSGLGLP